MKVVIEINPPVTIELPDSITEKQLSYYLTNCLLQLKAATPRNYAGKHDSRIQRKRTTRQEKAFSL